MIIVRTISELRRVMAPSRSRGAVGFVPTMGALHEGHASLVRQARDACATVVASVFVNPTQFNDPADLAAYPRTEARDAAVLEAAGADVLFLPAPEEIYPPGRATAVVVEGAALGCEGDHRPGHFNGVALVCLILFHSVMPDCVYLGQKDAQQVAVLRQVVRDLHLALEIRVGATVRDPDGLAMSSRNVRLSPEERGRALAIPRALGAGLAAFADGADPVVAARAALTGLDVEYVRIADFDGRPTLVVAARAGTTRLIDNVPLTQPELAGLTS